MASNKKSSDQIHNQINPVFKTRQNPNWKALIEAAGSSDDDVFELVQEVRKQFFISSSERPYLDRLAANSKISRPKVVGMDDPTFRRYIPILSYKPKQVKQVFNDLLDIFFFRDATTAFTSNYTAGPYYFKDGYELSYLVDGTKTEEIHFYANDFSDVNQATAEEIVAAINRKAQYSFAAIFDDRISKKQYIRIFTKTIGSTGSIEITGGRSNISLKMQGFIEGAGNALNTQWTITKVGSTTTFQSIGGDPINLSLVGVGDYVIIDVPGNEGTFQVEAIDLINNSFSFTNLFSTPGNFDHALNPDYFVKFFQSQKSVVFTKKNRALVWEINSGEVIIEMPSNPPIVRRGLIGSAHLNGLVGEMADRLSDSSMVLIDGSEWPSSGKFCLEPVEEIQTHILTISTDTNTSHEIQGRFDIGKSYTYAGKSGDILTGITPALPKSSGIFEFSLVSLSRDINDKVTVTTSVPHDLKDGEAVLIYGVATGTNFNGNFIVSDCSGTTFSYQSLGPVEVAATGNVRYERIGLAAKTKVYLTSANVNTGILGGYLYDESAPFVLSSYTAQITNPIFPGNVVLNLPVGANTVPDEQGFLIFEYGTDRQEGPVKYLRKAGTNSIVLDPSYVFEKPHPAGSNLVALRRRGGHVFSGLGKEYSFYLTDPLQARYILEETLEKVKSVGIFLKFIIRFPEIFYSDFDLYQQTDNPID